LRSFRLQWRAGELQFGNSIRALVQFEGHFERLLRLERLTPKETTRYAI